MAATNAISGISLVGSLVAAGADHNRLATILGFTAVVCATMNVVGGFLITDRMLGMFQRNTGSGQRAAGSAGAPDDGRPTT
jgi:NAD(P) transhydrogenase subunit alpha